MLKYKRNYKNNLFAFLNSNIDCKGILDENSCYLACWLIKKYFSLLLNYINKAILMISPKLAFWWYQPYFQLDRHFDYRNKMYKFDITISIVLILFM